MGLLASAIWAAAVQPIRSSAAQVAAVDRVVCVDPSRRAAAVHPLRSAANRWPQRRAPPSSSTLRRHVHVLTEAPRTTPLHLPNPNVSISFGFFYDSPNTQCPRRLACLSSRSPAMAVSSEDEDGSSAKGH